MCLPVDRSITLSPPQRIAHVIFSTSSPIDDVTAELPMFALIFTRKLRPMIIGSDSGWVTLLGMTARPAMQVEAQSTQRIITEPLASVRGRGAGKLHRVPALIDPALPQRG